MHSIPLSLYIHIPWCEKKCPYCDFNSHLARSDINEPAYIDALFADLDDDLRTHKAAIAERPIQSIFIGGGTPSLFSPDSFARLLTGLADRLDLAKNIEITLEANPGSSEASKFIGFRQAGINRLSIGVQSFNDSHLTVLGRVHNSNNALKAAGFAHDAGFDTFNLDLMFGLPGQTLAQSLADVKQAIALKPTHLSCYQLTIEPNTLFHHSPPITPNDDALWEMQTAIQKELANHGYMQYEVSAYAQNNRQCRHNLNYWQFGDYLGIGAGAHGKVTSANGQISRNWKIKHPSTYLDKASKLGGSNTLSTAQKPFEFMLNALRLSNGFDSSLFEQRTGLALSNIDSQLSKHEQAGLLQITPQSIKPSERGKQFIDSMLQDYLS